MKKRGIAVLQHICALSIGVLAGVILWKSYFAVGDYGTTLYPWEAAPGDYTTSELFADQVEADTDKLVRNVVIKNQMETNGVFDGKKVIDIFAYYNRREDYTGRGKETPRYYLEDLIKWNDYKFKYADREGNLTITVEDGTATELVTEADTQTSAAADESITGYAEVEESVTGDLKERYKTADGKNIRDFVSNEKEYNEYVSVLTQTAAQLSYNYREYQQFKDSYTAENSNLRYCLKTVANGKTSYVSNISGDIAYLSDSNVETYFTKLGSYAYYYPDGMECGTNIKTDSEFFRTVLNSYEYIFNEESKIWVGVDTAYPVQDDYAWNAVQYNEFAQYYIKLLAAVAVLLILYLALLIAGTLFTKEPQATDRIPFEPLAVAGCLIGMVLLYLVGWTGNYFFNSGETAGGSLLPYLFGGIALLASITFLMIYYSFVRRCKSGTFWANTLIGRAVGWVIKTVSGSGSLIIRIWLPYLAFLAGNLLLVLTGMWGIVFAFLIDMAVGLTLFISARAKKTIEQGIEKIAQGDVKYQVNTGGMYGDNLRLAKAVNQIGDGIRLAVEASMKDEKLKTDLITNVSHDIKTPLTSIINYVDLIKRENIQDEKIEGYIAVLDNKSQRLKQLTEDLVEASKISSGNIEYHFENLNLVELVQQTLGEFSEKFSEKHLEIIASLPKEAVSISADSRRIWRVVENLYNNICKYAMPDTRVYLDMEEAEGKVGFSLKNISAQRLNINAEELTERFIRGDISRNTEGSGLGLSIAKSLTEAQNGSFHIYLDGDLFKVTLEFPVVLDSLGE